MADWTAPTLATAYATFLANVKSRDEDAYIMSLSSTNTPTGAIGLNPTGGANSQAIIRRFSGSWGTIKLDIDSGGTGAGTAGDARTNLGLGTMATQAASAVAITGGTVTQCDVLYSVDDAKNIGANAARPSKIYIRSGLVIPVGADKYLTS